MGSTLHNYHPDKHIRMLCIIDRYFKVRRREAGMSGLGAGAEVTLAVKLASGGGIPTESL